MEEEEYEHSSLLPMALMANNRCRNKLEGDGTNRRRRGRNPPKPMMHLDIRDTTQQQQHKRMRVFRLLRMCLLKVLAGKWEKNGGLHPAKASHSPCPLPYRRWL
jgi:hypothetical protein